MSGEVNVLFVNVSVVARPTKVSVDAGIVIVTSPLGSAAVNSTSNPSAVVDPSKKSELPSSSSRPVNALPLTTSPTPVISPDPVPNP